MDEFEKRFVKLVENQEYGSSEILEELIELLNHHKHTISNHNLQELWPRLKNIDRSMHLPHHFRNEMTPYLRSGFWDHLSNYQNRWSNISGKVAFQLENEVSIAGKVVLSHSRSGLVRKVLKQLETKPNRIIQTRSYPGGEGVTQADAIQEIGLSVELIEDDKLGEHLKRIDRCILGCDQYDANSFINKVGSREIVAQLSSQNVPVVVVADSRKKVRKTKTQRAIFERVEFNKLTILVNEERCFYFN